MDMILALFPDYKGKITPFGYDWLGRFFCLDSERSQNKQPLILLFIPYSDQVLEIPASFIGFHNIVLTTQAEPATEANLFRQFLAFNKITDIAINQCADLKVPLYLGGKLTVENLNIMDLSLYWELMAQIALQTRDLATGASVNNFKIVQ